MGKLSSFLNVLDRRSATIRTETAIETCTAALRANIDARWRLFGNRPVIGVVRAQQGMLRRRVLLLMSNTFQPVLNFRIATADSGSQITCDFGLSSIGLTIFVAWMSVVALVWVADFSLFLLNTPTPSMMFLAGPCFAAGVGIGLVATIRFLAKDDWVFLLNFVATTVDGQVVGGDTP